jgi:hypothetical protein
MNRTYTGGPASPAPAISAADGMTLRDYFAAKAMAAYWTDPGISSEVAKSKRTQEYVAQWAYEMADAMLEEREG